MLETLYMECLTQISIRMTLIPIDPDFMALLLCIISFADENSDLRGNSFQLHSVASNQKMIAFGSECSLSSILLGETVHLPWYIFLFANFYFIFVVQLGVDTVPVLIGPVSYLLLSKPAKGVDKSFSLLSLIGKILPIYK